MAAGPFYLIGVAFALFFAVLLFNKPQQRLADRVLCLWFLVIVAHLLSYYASYVGIEKQHPHLLGLNDGLPFLYGPCLFFYARALVEPQRLLGWRDTMHLLPFIGYNLIYLPFFLTEASRKYEVYEAGITTIPLLLEIGIAAKLLSAPVYLVLVFHRLRRHGVEAEQYYSNTADVDLRWLRNLAVGLGLFWAFVLGTVTIEAVWGFAVPGQENVLIFAALVVGVVALGYFGLRQGVVFSGIAPSEPAAPVAPGEPSNSVRYQRSGLTVEDAQGYVVRLQALMEDEKLYLNSELTIEDIAQGLEIPRHYLTEVLNEHLGKNFFLFVNEYRIAEACRRIVDPQYGNRTLLAIGLESGFNSKSAFNGAFKRLTAMTPSQYRRSHGPASGGNEVVD